MNVTRETQEVIVASLIKSSYLFSICRAEMDSGYFSDPCCKVIYKSLETYYKKYSSTPGLNELLITIEECYYSQVGVNLSDVKDTCCRIYEYEEPDESFIKDKITDFLRKIRSSTALKEFVDRVKLNQSLESDKIVSELSKALDIQLSTTKVFMMNNADQIKEARQSAVGSTDQTKIIKSFISSLNSNLMFGGWQPSTVNMIVSPPGCFTGDTKVLTIDGKSHTLEELYLNKKAPGIYGSDERGNLRVGLSQEVYLSDYTDDLVEIEVDGKYKIRCTPDHPFMTRNGFYVKAEDLKPLDELMPIRREMRPRFNVGSSLYEVIVNGNDDYWFTHKLAGNLVDHPDEFKVIHHKDMNRRNNYPDNLEWFKDNKDHSSYHFHRGDYKKFVESGKNTRYTSEQISERNKESWKSEEYREKMRPVSRKNGKRSLMTTTLNYTKEFQGKTQRGKILSFINRLLVEFPDVEITEKNYESLVERSSSKRKVWLKGIRKYFDCPWDELMRQALVYNHKVTGVIRVKLDEKVPVYGIVDAKPFNNFAIALNEEEGVFVSNTGKSMFLINEGFNAAKQGFDVLHIFIGDMVEYDGFIRYLSCISGSSQSSLVMMPLDKQQEVIKICNQQYDNIFERLFILAYPSLSINVDTLMEDVNKFEKQLDKDFGLIIIDYPDNLVQEGRSLYEDGGTLYSSLERMARLTKSVVLVASQPQKYYWNHEIIPLEAASESSKKQMAVDVMLTFNTSSRGANFGSMLLAKARKGDVGKIFRFRTDFSKCKLEEIDESTYNATKSAYGLK